MKKNSRLLWPIAGGLCAALLLMSASISVYSLSKDNNKSACVTSMRGEKQIVGNGKVITKSMDALRFDTVQLCGHFEINIKPGNKSEVSIETDENLLPFLHIAPANNELMILPQADTSLVPSQISKVSITTPVLHQLYIGGDTRLRAMDITSDTLTITAGGKSVGHVRGNIKTLKLNLSGKSEFHVTVGTEESINLVLSGKSDVYLAGIVKSLNITTAGKVNIHAKDLTADKVTITGAGKSNIIVHAVKILSVISTGNNTVKYYGNPTINKSTFGKVTIDNMNSSNR